MSLTVRLAAKVAALLIAIAPVGAAFMAPNAFAANGPAVSSPAPIMLAQATPAAPPAAAPAASAPAAVPAPDASAPAADASAVPAPPPAATGEVENPYDLNHLWSQGDFVARSTIVILAIMSMGTWYIMIMKLVEQTRMMGQAKDADKNFWNAGNVKESVGRLKTNSAFRYIAESGVQATEHHEGTLTEQIDLHTWVTMQIQRSVDAINTRLQGGLAFLATVGSTAPFVGLFGTVWGIYHALIAIGLAGQASIDKVAGPVGEALIMTAIGLFVAVPAVLGYNWLVRRNKAVIDKVRVFSADLHSVLLKETSGGPSATRTAARTA